MAEVTLNIGGRQFVVACQDGEEPQLQQAAALLDAEASTLQNEIGRIPETRMLLMAGLMLADRAVEISEQAEAMASRVAAPAVDTKARAEADEAIAILKNATQRAESIAQKATAS